MPFRLIPSRLCYPKTMRSFFILILLVTVSLSPTTEARTLFVSPDGDDTTGESWQTAFTAIGDAVVSGVTGNEIWVRHGVYNDNHLVNGARYSYRRFRGEGGKAKNRKSRGPK